MTLGQLRRENEIVACMASFPARYPIIGPVIRSVSCQVDHLFVYLNETIDGFPFEACDGNVTVLDSNQFDGDLSANGKLFPLRFINDCLVFTVDDDFIYPPNYVERYKTLISLFDGYCCVATHGSIFNESISSYYDRSKTFVSEHALRTLQIVSLGGSGTFAFMQSRMEIDVDAFMESVMVDLNLSLAARAAGLPIWCLPRPRGWLRNIDNQGLFQKFKVAITHHTTEARKHDWSFAIYRALARGAMARLGEDERSRLPLDPELAEALETGEPPSLWRQSTVCFARRSQYLNLLLETPQ